MFCNWNFLHGFAIDAIFWLLFTWKESSIRNKTKTLLPLSWRKNMQLLFHFHNKKSKLFLREFDETLQGRFPLIWKREKYLTLGNWWKLKYLWINESTLNRYQNLQFTIFQVSVRFLYSSTLLMSKSWIHEHLL